MCVVCGSGLFGCRFSDSEWTPNSGTTFETSRAIWNRHWIDFESRDQRYGLFFHIDHIYICIFVQIARVVFPNNAIVVGGTPGLFVRVMFWMGKIDRCIGSGIEMIVRANWNKENFGKVVGTTKSSVIVI